MHNVAQGGAFLYQIIWNGHSVGTVEVLMEGMFYKFYCRCYLPQKGIYSVIVTDGNNSCNLGICVPTGMEYVCVSRVIRNALNEKRLSFILKNNDEKSGIPIATGKAFAYLDKINTARLHIANGQPEIVIDPVQDQRGSGRSQGYRNKSEPM